MSLKYYSFEQTKDRIAEFISPVKLDESTLLNLVRSKKLSPYIWFHGYVGTVSSADNTNYYDQDIHIVEPIRGYLKLDYERYLDDFQYLLFGNNRDIYITEIEEFSDLVHGQQLATVFNDTGVIFSKNILAESNVTLPIKIKALCDLGFQPGASVKWRDIFFSADEVERLNPKTFIQVKTEANLVDSQLEEIVTLKSKIESLEVQIEELTQKAGYYHQALDPASDNFAPEIKVGLMLNEYVEKCRANHSVQCGKDGNNESFVREDCIEDFYSEMGITGSKEKARLKIISNSITYGKPSLEVVKLAKSN